MKCRTFVVILTFLFSMGASAQANLIPTVNAMTNQQVWDTLMAINAAGETAFGKCKVLNATTCASCACDYYFRAKVVGSLGMYGWPKNPSSGDSTGCISTTQWGGYTAAMATSDFKANSRAMLLNALQNNACGAPVPPDNTGGVSILDNSKIFFVNPSESCANGKPLCGTTGLGSSVGSMVQFTKLSSRFCVPAYAAALKMKNNNAKFITCAQLNQNSLSTQAISQAASMVGQLNASYSVFELAGLQKYLDYGPTELEAMTTAEVALYYVATGKNSNVLPQELKDRVKPSKFDEVRAAGDKWIITSEITAAEAQLATISQGVVTGKNFTLEQALEYISANAGASAPGQ